MKLKYRPSDEAEWYETEILGGPLYGQFRVARMQMDSEFVGCAETDNLVLNLNAHDERKIFADLFRNPGTPFALKFSDEKRWRKWYVDEEPQLRREDRKVHIMCSFCPWGTGDENIGFVVDEREIANLTAGNVGGS